MADAYDQMIGGAIDSTTGLSVSNFTLNQAADAYEAIVQAKTTDAITHLGCRNAVITGSSPVFQISAQGVDGSGLPDGTIKGATNNAKATFTPTGNNDWNWLALTESFTPSAVGESFAIVIARSSGTIDGSNNCSFTTTPFSGSPTTGNPYSIQNDNGSRTRGQMPLIGYKTASRAYGLPLAATNQHAFSSASNPNEYAIKFTRPAGHGATYKLYGVRIQGAVVTAGATITLKLYTGGLTTDTGTVTTVLNAYDTDSWQVAGGSGRVAEMIFPPQTLNFGDTYRLSFVPSASNWTLNSFDVDANSDLDAWPGGSGITYSTRNGGNWTDLDTRRLQCQLILSDWTEPAGGAAGGTPVIGLGGAVIRAA